MQDVETLAVRKPCGQVEQVICDRVLRVHKGLRKTCSGQVQGRRVVAKCFMDSLARQRCRREREALEKLAERGIAVPSVVAMGALPAGQWCLVTEQLPDAVGVNHYVRDEHSQELLQQVLCACVQCLARMHRQGVLQMDLHLGNFLLSGGQVYAIDPGEMRFYRKPIRPSLGLRHLAIMMARFPSRTPEQVESMTRAYCQQRQLDWTDDLVGKMIRGVEVAIAANVRRFSPRVLRANRRTVLVRSRGLAALFARRHLDPRQARAWVDQWQAMRSQLLQSDLAQQAPHELVWEGHRYHVWVHQTTGFWRVLGLGLLPRRSPQLARFVAGRRQWLAGWERFWRQTTTHPPLALIEEYSRWTLARTYYIEYAS